MLFDRWLQHRSVLSTMLPLLAQWIDGSYVTNKAEPADIDVVTLLDGPAVDELPQTTQQIASLLVDGPKTRALWGVDSYVLSVYPEDHPSHGRYLHARGYWDWWFGRIRGDDTDAKGYLEVVP